LICGVVGGGQLGRFLILRRVDPSWDSVPDPRWGSLPDLGSLSDGDIHALLRERLAQAEETPDNRFLFGAIDILRAEIVVRGGDPFAKLS
jgi:hypothetical protein